MSSLKRSPHDFVFKEELGNGSYSRVYKAVDRGEPLRVYAVKVCSKRHIIHENKVKYVTIEKNTLNLLARAHHPGIVKLHYTFHDEENLYFVLDFAAGGELLSLLHRVGRFPEPWARHFIAQLIDTTEFIHSQAVIHRDLKPENVLLHRDGRLMVTDFGTATSVSRDSSDKGASFVGTAEYVSPELLLYNQCQFASDVWALGCMLYQFVQGSPPFRGDNELHTFEKIVSLEYPWANNNTTGGVVSLVRSILTLDPADRPTLAAIKQHKWFESVDWNNRELLWRGIWQAQPQRQQQIQAADLPSRNAPSVAKQKRRKPAKVANTTNSIVEWRKRLGIANDDLSHSGGVTMGISNGGNRKLTKPTGVSANANISVNQNNNSGINGSNRPTVRSNSMLKTPAVPQGQEQTELPPRQRIPGVPPRTPVAPKVQTPQTKPVVSAAVLSAGQANRVPMAPSPLNRAPIQPQPTKLAPSALMSPPGSNNNRVPKAPSPLNRTPMQQQQQLPQPQPTKLTPSALLSPPGPGNKGVPKVPSPTNGTSVQHVGQPQPQSLPPTFMKPTAAPIFTTRTPSPASKLKPMASGSVPRSLSPTKKPSLQAPSGTSSAGPQISALSQPPVSAPVNKTQDFPKAASTLGPKITPPGFSTPTSAILSSTPTPPTISQGPVGKPQSPAPRTAPPRLSVDTGQRPTVMTNGSTAVISTSNGGAKASEPTILKQDSVNVFEIPFNSSGPDMSLQSYKRVDNELITKLVAEHKSELRPSNSAPSLLTLYRNGTLQYKQSQSVRHMANIGDTSLSMYDFEFYERRARGFLILEKYHAKLWFISLARGNLQQQLPQGIIVNSDENWVDCIFRARQLVEDQALADRLNSVEVSSPRTASPTIPVTPIYSKGRTPSGGSFTPQKKYTVPSNIVVSSSRKQVLHAINRNGSGDASLGASAAFKSSQKK